MSLFKNRTVVGVICILLSLVICFGVTPLFNKSVSQKEQIIRVTQPILAGEEITADMVQAVEVGGYNLPENVIRLKENVVGKFATADLAAGDYIINTKVSDEPAADNAYLYNLDGSQQAMSITIKSFATGLSGKLQSGDIVSVVAPDFKKQGQTVIPPELKYVEVISVTASSGYDANTGEAPSEDDERELPSTVTLLVSPEQSRVLAELEADGKLMTGRDVAIAAMLGAEEFGFATAPLVTMGCVMMRVCNLDTCPVGIATQNPELRKRFKGKPEYVINFMKFIAEELREYMSKLGIRTIDELVGRSDLLYAGKGAEDRNVDLSLIINNPYIDAPQNKIKYNEKHPYDFQLEKTIDMRVLLKKLGPALEKGQKKSIEIDVTNTDRSVGTIFGSEITKRYGETLEDDSYLVKCNGAGGQSFGAFVPKGLTLELVGDSNDYFGKGLSGGKLIVYPPRSARFVHEDNIIIGNVALYGATSGKAYINGVAGERFAVRNSGATHRKEFCRRYERWYRICIGYRE